MVRAANTNKQTKLQIPNRTPKAGGAWVADDIVDDGLDGASCVAPVYCCGFCVGAPCEDCNRRHWTKLGYNRINRRGQKYMLVPSNAA